MPASNESAAQRNIRVVRDFQQNCMHAQRIDLMDRYLAPDLQIHLPTGLIRKGRENAFDWFIECTKWFTSRGIEVKMMLADDDIVFQLIDMLFDHTGDYFGLAPTGRRIVIPGLAAFKLRDGMITDHWGLYEMDTIPAQLGIEAEVPQAPLRVI